MFVRSLLIIGVLMVENAGTVAGPVVTFEPDWNKIFTGESLQMTCDVASTEQGNVTYYWFKDDYWIHSEKTFTISSALSSSSGNYQCQTSTSDRSDSTRLEVYNGYVILQTSSNVYEGDNLTLRCLHYPSYAAKQTAFYKNNAVMRDWCSEDELQIENVNMTSSCKYKCTKQVHHHLIYYQHSDETSVSVKELFSRPTIILSPELVREGAHVTLTCDTRLSPHRQNTVLQFAFYREGQNIREFSSSNQHEIPSATLNDSGDYKCEVQTEKQGVKKASTILTVQVSRIGEHEPFNHLETEEASQPGPSHVITAVAVTSLVLVLFLIGTALIFLYRTKQFPLPGNNHPPSKAEFMEPYEEAENIYTDLDTGTTRWQSAWMKTDSCCDFSQDPQKPPVNEPVIC